MQSKRGTVLRPIVDTIGECSRWDEFELKNQAHARRVRTKRDGDLVLLNYEDDIRNDEWNDFNRQCRGLIVDLRRRAIVAHPFDKFFNLDSHPETKWSSLPFDSGYEIALKYDGTMITAFSHNGHLRFATRSAFDNEQIRMAMDLANARYDAFSSIDTTRYTLVFELVSPRNRHLVDYDEEALILTGVRDLTSGSMLPYCDVACFAQQHGLRPPEAREGDLSSFLADARDGTTTSIQEGWVVRFGNGLYVKLKRWQYLAHVQIQRLGLTAQQLRRRYCLSTPAEWRGFVSGLPGCVRENVEAYGSGIGAEIECLAQAATEVYDRFAAMDDQKEFAIAMARETPRHLQPLVFALRSGKCIDALARRMLLGNDSANDRHEVVAPTTIKEWAFSMKD